MGLDIIARSLAGSARADAATALARSVPVGRFTDLSSVTIDAAYSAVITSGYAVAGSGGARYVADALATAALATAHPRACKASANGRYFRLLADDTGAIAAAALRDTADSDDTVAHWAASKYAKAIGARFVRYSPRLWTIAASGEWNGTYPGAEDWSSFPEGVLPRAEGATFQAAATISPGNGGKRGLDLRGFFPDNGAAGVVTAAVAAGDKAIHVTTPAAFAVGDWVLFRFGDIPFDTPETYNHGLARVASVNAGAGTITLDRAMPRPFTAGDLAAAVHNKSVRKVSPLIGVDFGDVVFADTVTDALHGVVIKNAEACRFGTVGGRNLSAGAFIAQYAYDWHVEKIYNFNSRIVGSDINTGNIARFAEARGTVGAIIARDCDGAIITEAASVLKIGYVEDDNAKGARTVFLMSGRSHVAVERVMLLGLGGQLLVDPQDNSQFTARHVHVRTATLPAYLGRFGREVGEVLTLEIAGAAPEVYRAADGYWVEKVIPLQNGWNTTLQIAPADCLIADFRVTASAGLTGGLTWLVVGRNGGPNVDTLASVVAAGQETTAGPLAWSICDPFNANRDKSVFVYVEAAPLGGGVPDLSAQSLVLRFHVIPKG